MAKRAICGMAVWLAFSSVLTAVPAEAQQGSGTLVESARRLVGALRRPGKNERLHTKVREAFKEVVKDAKQATVRVMCDSKPSALGAIVDAKGFVLTKFSELKGEIRCRMESGEFLAAQLVGVDKAHDLAMLKVEKDGLPVIIWSDSEESPPLGSWVATSGVNELPVSVGVVSAVTRRIPREPGFLGVQLADAEGARIDALLPGGVAEKGGLKQGDLVIAVDGAKIAGMEDLQKAIGQRRPNTSVVLGVKRGKEELRLNILLGRRSDAIAHEQRMAFQMRLGGEISTRSDDFPNALQHDTVLRPDECGGPLVGLNGKVIGLNIARQSRICSFAIPAATIVPLIKELKSGKGKEFIEKQKTLSKKLAELSKSLEALKRESISRKGKLRTLKEELVAAEKAAKQDDNEKLVKLVKTSKTAVEAAQVLVDEIKSKLKKIEDERDLTRSQLISVRN